MHRDPTSGGRAAPAHSYDALPIDPSAVAAVLGSRCPACGLGELVFHRAGRWRCGRCAVRGSAADLVAFHLHGEAFDPDDGPRAELVGRWLEGAGLLGDLAAWWRGLDRLTDAEGVTGSLRSFGLDPVRLTEANAARAFSTDTGAPVSVAHFRPALWLPCAVLPLHDLQGRIRSVVGLALKPTPRSAYAVAVAPGGTPGSGPAVMTSPTSDLVIGGASSRELGIDGWGSLVLTLTSGPLGFLQAVSREVLDGEAVRDATGRAVAFGTIGVLEADGWSAELAERIPCGCNVVVGAELVGRVRASVGARCTVRER